eukprot:COSAG02_NODE_4881_length_4866_cov_17.494860_5_plen_133_part_00
MLTMHPVKNSLVLRDGVVVFGYVISTSADVQAFNLDERSGRTVKIVLHVAASVRSYQSFQSKLAWFIGLYWLFESDLLFSVHARFRWRHSGLSTVTGFANSISAVPASPAARSSCRFAPVLVVSLARSWRYA